MTNIDDHNSHRPDIRFRSTRVTLTDGLSGPCQPIQTEIACIATRNQISKGIVREVYDIETNRKNGAHSSADTCIETI